MLNVFQNWVPAISTAPLMKPISMTIRSAKSPTCCSCPSPWVLVSLTVTLKLARSTPLLVVSQMGVRRGGTQLSTLL